LSIAIFYDGKYSMDCLLLDIFLNILFKTLKKLSLSINLSYKLVSYNLVNSKPFLANFNMNLIIQYLDFMCLTYFDYFTF